MVLKLMIIAGADQGFLEVGFRSMKRGLDFNILPNFHKFHHEIPEGVGSNPSLRRNYYIFVGKRENIGKSMKTITRPTHRK